MKCHFGLIVLLCCGWTSVSTTSVAQKFIAVFLENLSANAKFELYLVAYDKAARANVSVENPPFHQTVSIGSNSSFTVTLNSQYMLRSDEISSKVVTVSSDVDISVFGFNKDTYSADATTILPVEDLDTEYFVLTLEGGGTKRFAVATGVDNVSWVNVTVSGSLLYNGKQLYTGDTFSFSLSPHQVFQFQSPSDLTGTRVVASDPVALFTGHSCFSGPTTTCDCLFEQLHPVRNWGTSFAVVPLAGHTNDIIDIMAANADTLVTINNVTEHTLNPGSYVRLTLGNSMFVTSSKPIWISYLFQDRKSNRKNYDPFITSVSPLQLTRKNYRFVTNGFYDNYITVVSQASSESGFFLDKKPLNHYTYTTKDFDGFRSWEISLAKSDGYHEIYHEISPFTLYVYGLENMISYGYTMGQETKYPGSPVPDVPPVLSCFSYGAEFRFPLRLVSEAKLNISNVHLEDPTCTGVQDGRSVVIKVPFNRCGSKVLSENEKTVYMNTVYGTVPNTGVHRIEIPLKCEMEGNETLGWALHPQVTDVVSLGAYNVSLKLYHTDAFADLVTMFPYEVDLHGRLYVEFQVVSDDRDLQILVESCKASTSLEDSQKNYNVIQRGCPEDSTLQNHSVPDQRMKRFSLHVFKFHSFKEVYLSCQVIICHNRSFPNRCSQGCLHTRNRRDVRSSSKFLGSARLSQGPILLNSENDSQSSQTSYEAATYILSTLVGAMGVLCVVGLLILKASFKRQSLSGLEISSNCQHQSEMALKRT